MTDGAMYANRCGSQNSALAKFCANCGTPFSADLQPPLAMTPEISLPPQGPVPPPAYPAPSSRSQYAGFWLRFVAVVIDGILVGVFVVPFSLMVSFAIGLAGRGVSRPGVRINLGSVVHCFVLDPLPKCTHSTYTTI